MGKYYLDPNLGTLKISPKNNKDYFPKSKYVKELSPSHFDVYKTINLVDDKCCFVLFYAPWCGYCKKLRNIWKELGRVANFTNIYAFNCEKYKSHLNKMRYEDPNLIKTFPSLVLYKNKKPYKKYEGERTLKELLNFVLYNCEN
jgi:thiol-disulfide isomerase/thioredoxin